MQKHTKITKTLMLAAVLAASVPVTAFAYERTPGAAAVPRLESEKDCLRFDWGRATNRCDHTIRVTIAPTTSLTGTRAFHANGLPNTECAGIALSNTAWKTSWTGRKFIYVGNASGADLGDATIPSSGSYIFECDLTDDPDGSNLNSVTVF